MSFQSIKNIVALENFSPAEIILHIQDVGLLARSLTCLKCRISMKIKPFERSCDKFAWRCKKCRATKSIRDGSWFSRSHLPLQTILQITSMWCERKPSWLVRRELNIAQNTVIEWYNFCREICLEIMLKRDEKIGGLGKVIEFYDFKFEKVKYLKGNCFNGDFIFFGIEKGDQPKHCFLKVLQDKSRETLIALITRNIKRNTKVSWDYCKAHECLGDSGLEYLQSNYSISFENSNTEEELNSIEVLWSSIKIYLPDYNFSRGSLSPYLAEYMYRQLREHESSLFELFVNDIVRIYALGRGEISSDWRCESPKDDSLLTKSDPMWSTLCSD